MHNHLGAISGRLEAKDRRGVRPAAAFGIGALGRDTGGVMGLVDLIELDEPGKGQGNGAEPYVDLALVGVRAHHLAQFRARHARRNAPDVEQHLPSLRRRQRHFECVVEFHDREYPARRERTRCSSAHHASPVHRDLQHRHSWLRGKLSRTRARTHCRIRATSSSSLSRAVVSAPASRSAARSRLCRCRSRMRSSMLSATTRR